MYLGVDDHRHSAVEQLWEIAARGRGDDLQRLVRTSRNTASEALAPAVRGVEAILSGDLVAGTLLMQRAIRRASAYEAAYLSDILLPALTNHGEFEAAKRLVCYGMSVERLAPCTVAHRAVLAALAGDMSESRYHSSQALKLLEGLEDAVVYGRVVLRLATAAYYRSEFDEAFERALSAVHWCGRAGSRRLVCAAYTILYGLAADLYDDGELARHYAREIWSHATLAGDVSFEKYSALCLLFLAAELADTAQVESHWKAYHYKRRSEQYATENFHIGVVAVLRSGWQGRFDAAVASLDSLRKSSGRSLSEKALCDALEAVAHVASWDLRKARALARLAISETITPCGNEVLHERRRRRAARALAALVCLCIGDTVRGRRALTLRTDLATTFGNLDVLAGPHGVRVADSPPLLRGYVRFLNSAVKASIAVRPRGTLTPAESEVLRALWEGTTLAQVAIDLGKSPKTVRCQVASIYAKLSASNRTQALRRAAELGFVLEITSGDWAPVASICKMSLL